MSFGSTSGRGLEGPFAPYVYGAVLVVTVLLWFWFRYDIRKRERDADREDGHEDRRNE